MRTDPLVHIQSIDLSRKYELGDFDFVDVFLSMPGLTPVNTKVK